MKGEAWGKDRPSELSARAGPELPFSYFTQQRAMNEVGAEAADGKEGEGPGSQADLMTRPQLTLRR